MYVIEHLYLTPVSLKLKTSFDTAHQHMSTRKLAIINLVVKNVATGENKTGLGELQSFDDYRYTLEAQATSLDIIRNVISKHLKKLYFSSPRDFAKKLGEVMFFGSFAKSAIEMAVWDAYGKFIGKSLKTMIGGVHDDVPVSIALNINAGVPLIIDAIKKGYQRIKLKVDAERTDFKFLLKILCQFPNQQFSIDANSSFNYHNAKILNKLPKNIAFIEQPFAENDFVDHGLFQAKSSQLLSLDESINNIHDVKTMIALKSAKALTIKQGKIGGITAALAAIELCNQYNIQPWIGGMFSSNIGRSVDLALASLSNITFSSDISDSRRYFEKDITQENFYVESGYITVPSRPGLGINLNESFTISEIIF